MEVTYILSCPMSSKFCKAFLNVHIEALVVILEEVDLLDKFSDDVLKLVHPITSFNEKVSGSDFL